MTSKSVHSLSRSTKLCLIDHLTALSNINSALEIEKNFQKKSKLKQSQYTHINSIKSLINSLNSVGKLSDKETFGLLKLDLMNMKDVKFKYRISVGDD
jgi:hypothetical protein